MKVVKRFDYRLAAFGALTCFAVRRALRCNLRIADLRLIPVSS